MVWKYLNYQLRCTSILIAVIRAYVPKLNLDDTFEQKNEIAKAVEEELEKVFCCFYYN